MKSEDFYNLRIGQTVYYKWDNICDQCSLEPPKEKKKYWQWVIKNDNGIYTPNALLDDEGNKHSGDSYYAEGVWDRLEKKKIESVFWEE